jgi:hypothetical protein
LLLVSVVSVRRKTDARKDEKRYVLLLRGMLLHLKLLLLLVYRYLIIRDITVRTA